MSKRSIRTTLAVVIGVLVSVTAYAQVPFERGALAGIELGQELQFTVPAGAIEMRLSRLDFTSIFSQPVDAQRHPRYFFLANEHRQIYISAWFEPAAKFKGLRDLWEEEVAALYDKRPKPQDVVFGEVGGWKTVTYKLPSVKGEATIAHMRAHWVEDDTWIDLHLSAQDTRPLPERFASLDELLRSIRVNRKIPTDRTHLAKSLPEGVGQVRLDLPATEKVYVYDVTVPGSIAQGVEGALLVARVGAGTVTLQSLPRAPHRDCEARVFAHVLALASEKRLDPSAVQFSRSEGYSLHVYPRIDEPTRWWHAVFPLDNLCIELSVSMPRQFKDDAPLVRSIVESVRVAK